MTLRILLATLMLPLGLLPLRAQAQTGSIQATLTILPSVTGAGVRNLDFGSISPGSTSTVPALASGAPNAAAGQFEIGFSAGVKFVDFSFALPTDLVHTSDPTAKIPVGSWTGAACEMDGKTNVCGPPTAFTPSAATYTWPLLNKANTKALELYVGGSTGVGATKPGVYTGTITLTYATRNK